MKERNFLQQKSSLCGLLFSLAGQSGSNALGCPNIRGGRVRRPPAPPGLLSAASILLFAGVRTCRLEEAGFFGHARDGKAFAVHLVGFQDDDERVGAASLTARSTSNICLLLHAHSTSCFSSYWKAPFTSISVLPRPEQVSMTLATRSPYSVMMSASLPALTPYMSLSTTMPVIKLMSRP